MRRTFSRAELEAKVDAFASAVDSAAYQQALNGHDQDCVDQAEADTGPAKETTRAALIAYVVECMEGS